ncbi:MAG: hypothetical protein RBR78_00045 [Flavobacteriaceae bacterium]|jgi:hypothetical protein|nr:hypothetical protein [Flavobacteriaceae bacterium]
MRQAVVLINGYIVYLDTITDTSVYDVENTDITFDYNTGRVLSFTKNGHSYMAVFNSDTGTFKNYVKIFDFYNNSKPTRYKESYITSIGNSSLESSVFKVKNIFNGWDVMNQYGYGVEQGKGVAEGTEVILVRESINYYGSTTNKLIVETKTFIFQNRNLYNYEDFNNIDYFNGNSTVTVDINTNHTDPLNVEFDYIEKYTSSIKTKRFRNPITNNYYLYNYIINNIQEITFLLYKTIYKNYALSNYLLFEGFLEVFYKHFEIIHHFDYAQNPNYGGTDFYYKNYTEAYFGILRVRLIEFYYWSKSLTTYTDVNNKKHDLIIRIVSLFHEFELSILDLTVKTNLLKKFLNDNTRIMGRWNPFFEGTLLSEEEVVIKIVKSIKRVNEDGTLNYEDINTFMDILNSTTFFKTTKNETLFEFLYDKIDPDVIFGGAGNRGKFVDAVYQLWLNSKYNSKADLGSIVNHQYHYTEFNALIYDAELDEYTKDTTAAPRIIPYESEKKWLWNDNNFKFIFKDNKIIAAQEKKNAIGSLFPNINNLYELLFEEIPHHIAYGYYHIFQPVNLTIVGDTVVKVPYDFSVLSNNGENFNPCDIESTGRGSNLPIFYLKFIDDIAERKNTEETILLAIDVLSVAVGGWGIARRMIAEGGAILIRKAFTAGLVEAEKAVLRKALKSAVKTNAFNTLELLFGSLSIFNTVVNGNCESFNDCNSEPPLPDTTGYANYQRCMAIQKWLFALEILSLSGDVIARNFFKKSTRELNQILPGTNPYTNISDVQYQQMKTVLNGLDELDNLLLNYIQALPPSVATKVDNLPSDKKFAFMFDFDLQKRADAINEFNIDNSLIDVWGEFSELLSHRKSIATLRRYKEVVNNQWLQIHTYFGHHSLIPPVNGTTKRANVSGAHRSNIFVEPPPSSGQISWVNPPPKNTNPTNPNDGYTLGKLQRNMSDIPDDTSIGSVWKGGVFPNGDRGGYLAFKKDHACWPKNYSVPRINEEKAVVLGKINSNTKPTEISKSGQYHYEIPATDGHPIKVIFDGDPMNGGTLNNIFPSNDPKLFQ